MVHSNENKSAISGHEETTREVRSRLVCYFSSRPEMGFDKMLLNLALEPANPFDPKRRRKLKKGFVLIVLIGLALVGTFVYFNIFPGAQ